MDWFGRLALLDFRSPENRSQNFATACKGNVGTISVRFHLPLRSLRSL
jgi:hypothetical protein